MMSHETAQRYARTAGVLFLLTMIFGYFGEMYVPSKLIVPHDAAATANNIVESESFFRMGFASYLVEAACDVALSLILYVLLRRVNHNIALLSAFFGLVSTAVFAAAELFFYAALVITKGESYLSSFTLEQRQELAMLAVKIFGSGAGIFMLFYGIASFARGYLIYRSRFLPKVLGLLLMLGGAGFIIRNFLFVLAPSRVSGLLLAPMFLAGLSLMFWLLVKGVDGEEWDRLQGDGYR